MKQYLCSRYPVDKRNGGVSRAWLLDQRHSARYPNLLVEIALHPAPPALIALKAGVSEDVLVDILLGKDSISYNEAQALRKALYTDAGYPNYDYAFSEALSPYEETEDGDSLKTARKEVRKLKGKHPAIPLIKKLLKEDVPPHAAVAALDFYWDYLKPEYARRAKITPRMRPLKEWEDYEHVELDASMIDELQEEATEALREEYKALYMGHSQDSKGMV